MSIGVFGLAQRHRHDHALAGGEPVGLDHDRRALLAHVGRASFRIGESAIGARSEYRFAAEVLGEALGAFELCRRLARAERLDAGGREIVDDAGRERRLRADHDEIDRVGLQNSITAGMVGDVERDAFGLAGDAGIARRAPQLGQQRGSGDLPRESVFAAAGTEQEDVHEMEPDAGIAKRKSVARICLVRQEADFRR